MKHKLSLVFSVKELKQEWSRKGKTVRYIYAPDIDCKVFFMGKASEYIPGSFVKVRIMDSMDFDLIGEVEK